MSLHLVCPTIVVSATASGQGKTTVTAALARAYVNKGLQVQVFKLGPDYIDPMLHEVATGRSVYQLDTWMTGEADVAKRLQAAATEVDVIVIEGVMGLFDGSPSTADFAARYGLPVLAVVDAGGMAQTFGAVVHGLANYRKDVWLYGVCANGVGSDYHAQLLQESIAGDVQLLGRLPKQEEFALPSRHLGLVPAHEQAGLLDKLDSLACVWAETGWTELPPAFDASALTVETPQETAKQQPYANALAGKTIAIAYDDAFCFIYPANVDLLHETGAELVYFSPVAGDALPACDALWLPGGYPELHLQALEKNVALKEALQEHVQQNKPVLAECGGMLYCLESLTNKASERGEMAGVLAGSAVMQKKLTALGLQEVALDEGVLRGHTFHYAQANVQSAIIAKATNPNKGSSRDAVYRERRLLASFVHFYFPSNPQAVARLFQ